MLGEGFFGSRESDVVQLEVNFSLVLQTDAGAVHQPGDELDASVKPEEGSVVARFEALGPLLVTLRMNYCWLVCLDAFVRWRRSVVTQPEDEPGPVVEAAECKPCSEQVRLASLAGGSRISYLL